MKAEIITIGTEILIGQVVDTNSAWLGEQLHKTGVELDCITSISDKPEKIKSVLEQALKGDSRLIIVTGGLGPTKDDITRNIVADFFGVPLEEHLPTLEKIKQFFKDRGREITPTNRRQALIPKGAEIFENNRGTAPGMLFSKGGKDFLFMPGVPFEMKDIFLGSFAPRLAQMAGNNFIRYRTLIIEGIGESDLSDVLEDFESNLPQNMSLAYLPKPGIIRLRLGISSNGSGQSAQQTEELLENYVLRLKGLVDKYLQSDGDTTAEEELARLLASSAATVATAESCTGGNIAARITSLKGSSAYYKGSIVAYSNEVKIKQLGVTSAMLEEHGAVSQMVVEQMAQGAKRLLEVDYAIATSGIAGPSGGTPEKPVGTIWIAVATPENVVAKKFLFGKDRQVNIEKSSTTALYMLIREL